MQKCDHFASGAFRAAPSSHKEALRPDPRSSEVIISPVCYGDTAAIHLSAADSCVSLKGTTTPSASKGPSRTDQKEPEIKTSVTTITLIVEIEGFFNTGFVFGLLPVSKVQLALKNKRKKMRVRASEVVKDAEEGAIVSVRSMRDVRGLRRSSQSPAFQNSITIDVFIDGRIVSVKLSCDLVQLCGATSREQGEHAVEYLLAAIAQIQKLVAWKNDNVSQAEAVFRRVLADAREWFHTGEEDDGNTTGGECGPSSASIADSPDLARKTWAEWSSLRMLKREPDAQLLYEFLSCRFEQLDSLGLFVSDLDWFRKLNFVADSDLAIKAVDGVKAVKISMLNRKYDLGRRLDLFDLKCYIHQLESPFYAHYDSACEKFLIVERRGTVPLTGNFHRRRENYFHTFMVYRSGVVTQSGVGDEDMDDVSRDFIAMISGYLRAISLQRSQSV